MTDTQQHPEQQLEQYIALFLTKIVRIIQIVIPLLARFSKEHPNIFLVLTSVVIIYVAWRIVCNMITILKRLSLVFLILFIISLFLRGFDQVVYGDLPSLYRLVTQNQDLETVLTQWTSYLGRTSLNNSQMALKFFSAALADLFNVA